MPDQNEVREDQNGNRKVWNGNAWMDLRNPNAGIPSGRTDAQDLDTFKNGMTGLGGLASLLLPEASAPVKILTSAIGAMTGRGIAHGAAATSHAEQPSLAEDLGTGATDGAMMEGGPAVVGQSLKYGGKFLKAAGDALPENMWHRIMVGEPVAEFMGLPRGVGASAAGASKPLLTMTGRGAEATGNAINGRTTSQLLRDAWEGITKPDVAPVLQRDALDAGATKYAAKKTAATAQQKAAAEGSGLGGNTNWETPPEPRSSPSWERYNLDGGGDFRAPQASGAASHDVGSGTPDPTWGHDQGQRTSDWMGSKLDAIAPKPSMPADLPPALRGVASESDIPNVRMHGAPYDTAFDEDIVHSAEASPQPPVGRELPRRDELWGPGSTDKGGELAQADFSKANLKYDPQTPTSYLREQLAQERDPAQQQFLVSALRQRQRLDRLP